MMQRENLKPGQVATVVFLRSCFKSNKINDATSHCVWTNMYSCVIQLEYFMIQCLKHKAKERPEKRRGNKENELRPPHLEQPGQRSTTVSNNKYCFYCEWCWVVSRWFIWNRIFNITKCFIDWFISFLICNKVALHTAQFTGSIQSDWLDWIVSSWAYIAIKRAEHKGFIWINILCYELEIRGETKSMVDYFYSLTFESILDWAFFSVRHSNNWVFTSLSTITTVITCCGMRECYLLTLFLTSSCHQFSHLIWIPQTHLFSQC